MAKAGAAKPPTKHFVTPRNRQNTAVSELLRHNSAEGRRTRITESSGMNPPQSGKNSQMFLQRSCA
jgi:hypothetical protein